MEEWAEKLPRRVSNWQAEAEYTKFDRETIFDHINGGAELYLSYDFKGVLVRKYTNDAGDEIVVDIYDMGSGEEAFGVFSSECEYGDAGIGKGSEYSGGLLRFWQDRYFVSILAARDDPEIEAVIREMGQHTAGIIGGAGLEPMLVKILPEKYRDQRRVRFFHTPLVLSKHYYLADDNILALGRDTDCLLAELPGGGDEPIFLLIIEYRDETRAKKAHARFLATYLSGAEGEEGVRTENGRWTLTRLRGRRLFVVLDAPGKERAEDLFMELNMKQRGPV
jgi:hypothetical protein